MRTRRFYKYLMAMIIALGTTANVFAQEERALKIYFNEYKKGETAPRMLVTDDNNAYDIPAGVTVSSEGVAWAGKSRFFEWVQQSVTDRIMADYLSKNDKKNSHLKLTFTDFPYEVNVIQWNAMNDLLSGSVTDFFKNYRVTTKCVPMSGNGFAYTEENWSLNLFSKQTSFTQMDIPWKSGAVLNGLTSFEISELYEVKIGLFGWTLIDLGQTELSDKNRTFIKAGWNGSNTNSNISDDDDENWAFKVKFTLPDIRMRSYKCTFANNKVNLGELDNNIIVGESGKHALRGYIADHAGAVVPTYDPADINNFHFEYEADPNQIVVIQNTGLISNAKVAGDIPVTVKLMRPEKDSDGNFVFKNGVIVQREVCRYTQTIHVYSNDPTRSEIAIGFLNGNKGYDVTVGDQNAQIQGIITKYGENITLSNGTSGYHFEYSEDSNGEIIDIDPLTGKITAKKEGDVVVSAVLKNGGTIRSNTYTYSLHVFAQHEGLDWKLEKTYTYTNGSNINEWKISTNTNSLSNKWESKDLLMVNTTINGSSDWKQIACFTTPASQNWRGICQTIQFDLRIPKYTKVTGTYPLAGNLNIGSSKGSSIKYGFESKDLGAVDAATADTNVKDITWKTQGYHNGTNASTNKYPTQIIADATSYNNGNIGNEKNYQRNLDNSTGETHITRTRYLAIMAYLHKDNSYPGDASFGFKGIPTYEYYSTVTYYKNDGTEDVWYKTDTPLTTTDKTKSFKMPNTKKNLPERAGYEFLGWSTDPNATTAEYPGKDGDFYPYDDVNGGGKGPVDLYAVWRAIPYTVTLNHNYPPYETEEIFAYYGQPMPEDESIVAPTRTGYDFTGYRTQKDITPQVFYYDAEMKSAHIYDKTSDYTIFANWEAHTTKITFDFQGGNGSTTEVTATYGEAMPTATAPSRTGYTFAGYYYYSEANGQGTKYYNADMTSVRTWNVDEPEVTLHAVWNAIPYTVTLNHNYYPYETEEIVAYYGQPMPEDESIVAPTRTGYDFTGYRTQIDITPQVFYYDAEMKSAHIYDKTNDYTIFANWEAHTTKITFDFQGGNSSTTEVTATYGEAMPTEGVQAPQRQGYTFGGYYSKQNGAGTQYYTADMTSATTWNIDERLLDPQVTEVTLYAKWIKVLFTITLDADGGTLDYKEINTWGTILEKNANSLVLQVEKNESKCTDIWCSNRINIKPGYKLLGWYTEPQTEEDAHHHPALHPGTLVYSVDPGNNFSYHFRAVSEEANPKYWNSEKKWVGTDDLTLYAHYEMIFEVENDVITFLDSEPKNCVSGEDLTAALDYAKNHGAKLINTLDMTHPDTGADNKQGEDIMKAFEDAKAEAGSIVSPNALIYFTNTWPQNRKTNAITMRQNGGLCQDLVVTDRYSMRIPIEFNAQKASYARDAGIVDDETDQAKNSSWGTLCLPYAIKNKNSHVKLYWLESTANNYMEFEEFDDDAIIPANTPVLYCRTDGKVSSKINIVEANVNVPENADYTPVIIDYANPKKGTYPLESASATLQDWEFRGNLKTNIFYGARYVGEIEENAQRVDNGDVYYFKQNKFTHLTPAMTKMVNGKEVHYNAGKMTIFPYRAYFFKKGTGGSAKIASYSILVVDEFGNTTDITNAVFGDGEGDGKIYDLNGIRVMQPVKGRLYIVNGQKKVYR